MMLIVMMASAVALATTTTTTASTTLSIPAATPLAVVSRLDSYGQRMGTTGTSVPRSFSLDLRQGMPQFIKLDICEHYNIYYIYILISKSEERPFKVQLLISYYPNVVAPRCSNLITRASSLATQSIIDYFPILNLSSSNSFFTHGDPAVMTMLKSIFPTFQGDPAVMTMSKRVLSRSIPYTNLVHTVTD